MNLKKKITVTQKLCNKVQAVHTLEKKKQKTQLLKLFKSQRNQEFTFYLWQIKPVLKRYKAPKCYDLDCKYRE